MHIYFSFVKQTIAQTIDAILFVCGLMLISTLLETINQEIDEQNSLWDKLVDEMEALEQSTG